MNHLNEVPVVQPHHLAISINRSQNSWKPWGDGLTTTILSLVYLIVICCMTRYQITKTLPLFQIWSLGL